MHADKVTVKDGSVVLATDAMIHYQLHTRGDADPQITGYFDKGYGFATANGKELVMRMSDGRRFRFIVERNAMSSNGLTGGAFKITSEIISPVAKDKA